ncbi:MAG TPA: DUF362 domain-containing protein [Candidatus Polarisedimenticolia bacterium]
MISFPHPIAVAVAETGEPSYPREPPFDPPEHYPELHTEVWHLDPANRVYAGVREALRLLGFDTEWYGTPHWNPLSALVRPGDRVVIKPNLVRHFHGDGLRLDALITHGSVVRAVLDYVILALKGRGDITIGDSPLQYADFPTAVEGSGLARVVEDARRYAGVEIRLVDFRRTRSEKRGGIIMTRLPNDGDPGGYRVVDLKGGSRFAGLEESRTRRFRVTQYDPRAMRQAHNAVNHAYLFPAAILRADVVINIPKLKTHRKAGVTAAMKNLVGINGSKDWLPHHTMGPVSSGGDEYLRPSLRKEIISRLRDGIEGRRGAMARRALHLVERGVRATGRLMPFPDPYWEGSWHGNDTVWRMVHDLHRVLFHADATGLLREEPQRRYLALVDAVIAGEGEGPMRPTPKGAGLIIAGENPAAVDIVCARVMGFDEGKIPLLRNAIGGGFHPDLPSRDHIEVLTNAGRWRHPFDLLRAQTLSFTPPAGWAGAIELDT